MKKFKLLSIIALVLALALMLTSCDVLLDILDDYMNPGESGPQSSDLGNIPEFSGYPYVIINDNKPFFEDDEITTKSFEEYAPLDRLGRCGVTISCIGFDLMPTEKRGSIGMVKPSGWQTVKYDCVDGKYLYNRCHLIGFQLTGENANELNLITGTRFMNVDGMLPFENLVADYIKETKNHVMYRVSPIYNGSNLVADGVLMEAYSVEDNGDGIEFCVYVYNNQPGVRINYADGTSKLDDGVPFPDSTITLPDGSDADTNDSTNTEQKANYYINLGTEKYHLPTCTYANPDKYNVDEFYGTEADLEDMGFTPCGICKP